MIRSAIAIMFLGLCLPVWAQPEMGGDEQQNLVRQGGLRPQQRGQLRQLQQKFEGRSQDVLVRLSQRRVELAELLKRDDVDKATVKAKIHEILALEKQRQELMVDEYFEAKAKLPPQQFVNFRGRILRGLLVRKRARAADANP